ncbi:MAG TPA: class I SAM-dependent methyltransferase [bacterium]|nr:class I SAM-dependent methyltransferase [bacterium]HPN30162.1 class I SAM-dependent methyltransferase [bacterium]
MSANHKHKVCPFWMGYLLLNPFRYIGQNPKKILKPFVKENFKVLEIGCGMGFFSIEIARLIGENGKLYCVDIQDKMLEALKKRAEKKELSSRIELIRCSENSLMIDKLKNEIDFVLAFAVVHEIPDKENFFNQISAAAKTGAKLLIAEPKKVISKIEFNEEIESAEKSGFKIETDLNINGTESVLLSKENNG